MCKCVKFLEDVEPHGTIGILIVDQLNEKKKTQKLIELP